MVNRVRSPRIFIVAAAALLLVATSAVIAFGSSSSNRHVAHLAPVPHDPQADGGSNVSGVGKLKLIGRRTLDVRVHAEGLSPFLPHAMHIHGHEAAAEIAHCPGADRRDEITDDGLIETAEGIDDYGPVQVSFTTHGDTSPDSTLALERFVHARYDGTLDYHRRFKVPLSIAKRIDQLHVVLHGQDINGDEQYDGPTGALGVPIEAELPVACGGINPAH